MCGIVGILQPESRGRIPEEILGRMNSALTHRGPDEAGSWTKGRVGLAMRRLRIIDLEGGRQPVSDENQRIWAVFNGEIYNFPELQKELLLKGHRLKSRSDTEVIVHLYEEEGENFVRRLRGMFAIALWDDEKQKLLLCRDRVGIKPLHYWFKDGTLLFASEIKALLEHPAVGRGLSLPAMGEYLSFLYIPAPRTIYREISKLPAGHFLKCEKGEIEIEPYWDFSYEKGPERSEVEWVEGLKAGLRESVEKHLVSDVPLGAFLSGGMDSSTVVAWMAEAAETPVKTYSLGFEDPSFDELSYAREVARHFKTDHHEKQVKVDAFDLIPKILKGFDEPFGDASAIPTFLVSQFAREEVTVALSGDGGDELFAGYLWTRKEAWLHQYRGLPRGLRATLGNFFLSETYRPVRGKGFLDALRRFLYDGRSDPAESFSRRAQCFQPWMKEGLLRPWVREAIEKENRNVIQDFFDRAAGASLMEKFLYIDSKVYLPDDLLTKVDRMSMLHSLEVRVPLLDHELIRLAGQIPFSLKLKGSRTKHILKEAMKDRLPASVLAQRKQGFQVPLGPWFQGPLSAFAEKILLEEKNFTGRYFEPDYVKALLGGHRAGRQRYGNQIYALVILELWGRLLESSKGSFTLKEGAAVR